MKKVFRVNTGILVGFGYEITPNVFKIKTIKGIFNFKKEALTLFDAKLITIDF